MTATKQDVDRWIEYAKKCGYAYIISVCDTFDHEDYPCYCKDEREVKLRKPDFDNVNMQQINEVINVKEGKS